jgi:AcrR family transcriptional regulator
MEAMTDQPPGRGPGRPATASREDVLDAATKQYLACDRIDVQAIALELGLARTTIYNWYRSRENLVGAVLVALSKYVIDREREATRGKGGQGLLTMFDQYNRAVVEAPSMRAFVDQERDTALRIVASEDGPVQGEIVALIRSAIEEEVAAGNYESPMDVDTLAYAIVRIGEAFLYNDAVMGIRGDVNRLKKVQAALLGVA